MSLETLVSLVSRVCFLGAFFLLTLVVIEIIANAIGYTILQGHRSASVIELAVVLLVFVITVQLRGMKEEFRRRR